MRYALGIEYDGTDFSGWQRLSHRRSVQADVEAALSFVADHPVEVTCAGRTDAGVHAHCQVVHFDSDAARSERAWTHGANSRLAHDVAILWSRAVPDDFHARFGARARRYRYTIQNRSVRVALQSRFVTWERAPLDVEAMRRAAAALVGEHDFSAFRTAACQANSPNRNVHEVRITRQDEIVTIEIEANAFLHHMVRNIVGSLLPIGRGERAPEWLAGLLHGRDRRVAGPTAPASGLAFVSPRYPREWNLPDEVGSVRTRIKYCGLTRAVDVACAIELGIDAIGFVFTRRSGRFVGVSQARTLRRALPPFVVAVALFMDDEASWIEEVVAAVQPDLLQFHGSESAGFASSFSRPYLKAIAMGSVVDVAAYAAEHAGAAGFLLDSHAAGQVGGTGEAFDWRRAPALARPCVLAGGLDARNVAQAISIVRPYAVDVSSGIEAAPGIKDPAKMRAFANAVRSADRE